MIDWRMRRVRWMFAGGLLALLVAVGAIWAQRSCRVVVHNAASFDRSRMVIIGPGWRWVVADLPADASRTEALDENAGAGRWELSLRPGGGPVAETWFEPGPGRRLIVRIRGDDGVEWEALPAWWE
ncbi:MAG: hypothetical protein R3F03_03100 [Opitutaceae bacterium]